jgi:hypothetical protein
MSEALADVGNVCDKSDLGLMYTFSLNQARFLSLRGDHAATLKLLEDLLSNAEGGGQLVDLPVKYHPSDLDVLEEAGKLKFDPEGGGISKSELATVYVLVAEMHMKLGNWKRAIMAYRMLDPRFPTPGTDQMTTDQHGAMLRGAQECLYQMKKYDQCIVG